MALCFLLGFCFHCRLFSEHWNVCGLFNDCFPIQMKLFTLRLLKIYVCKHKHKRQFYSITMSKIIKGSLLWLMNSPFMNLNYNFSIKHCSPSCGSGINTSESICLPHYSCATIGTMGRSWPAKQCYSMLFPAMCKTMAKFYHPKHPE